eukprot:TRINITY_DN91612_c0_g1_i1.p1 TRINITY_DN91612_c0_g1~~TRINITY_DN91612_c0_g1_i1.p1  ORF type:complete len:847 (-),score=176.40 TRINITY_DN91612_c0_g1_i1:127-2667(-)
MAEDRGGEKDAFEEEGFPSLPPEAESTSRSLDESTAGEVSPSTAEGVLSSSPVESATVESSSATDADASASPDESATVESSSSTAEDAVSSSPDESATEESSSATDEDTSSASQARGKLTCPEGYYQAEPLLLPCDPMQTLSGQVAVAHNSKDDVTPTLALTIPANIEDLRIEVRGPAGRLASETLRVSVEDSETRQYVLESPAVPEKLQRTWRGDVVVKYTPTVPKEESHGDEPAILELLGVVPTPVVIKLGQRGANWLIADVAIRHYGFADSNFKGSSCPSMPQGCARWESRKAAEQVYSWSKWAKTAYGSGAAAWEKLVPEAHMSVPFAAWPIVWSSWSNASSELALSQGGWESAFYFIDSLDKRDGLIDQAEFVSAFAFAEVYPSLKMTSTWFHERDATLDVSWKRFQGAYGGFTAVDIDVWKTFWSHLKFKSPSAQTSFGYVDFNNDGYISESEFEILWGYDTTTVPTTTHSTTSATTTAAAATTSLAASDASTTSSFEYFKSQTTTGNKGCCTEATAVCIACQEGKPVADFCLSLRGWEELMAECRDVLAAASTSSKAPTHDIPVESTSAPSSWSNATASGAETLRAVNLTVGSSTHAVAESDDMDFLELLQLRLEEAGKLGSEGMKNLRTRLPYRNAPAALEVTMAAMCLLPLVLCGVFCVWRCGKKGVKRKRGLQVSRDPDGDYIEVGQNDEGPASYVDEEVPLHGGVGGYSMHNGYSNGHPQLYHPRAGSFVSSAAGQGLGSHSTPYYSLQVAPPGSPVRSGYVQQQSRGSSQGSVFLMPQHTVAYQHEQAMAMRPQMESSGSSYSLRSQALQALYPATSPKNYEGVDKRLSFVVGA